MSHDFLTFWSELPRRFKEIGSLFPSSPMLAKALAKPVAGSDAPVAILEVGPGTGPVTRRIIQQMGSKDTLVICEINDRLLERLQHALAEEEDFQRHCDRIRFHCGPVQELLSDCDTGEFDVIVCSLPFLNFPAPLVAELMDSFHRVLRPGGTFSYFEYAGLSKIASKCTWRKNRNRVREIRKIMTGWRRRAQREGSLARRLALLNVPPANAFHLQFDSGC